MRNCLALIILTMLYSCNDSFSSTSMICEKGKSILIDGKYIYEQWSHGPVKKFKITNRDSASVSGHAKNEIFDADIYVTLYNKTYTVNRKDVEHGTAASYTIKCN